jgi:hypothetical protein
VRFVGAIEGAARRGTARCCRSGCEWKGGGRASGPQLVSRRAASVAEEKQDKVRSLACGRRLTLSVAPRGLPGPSRRGNQREEARAKNIKKHADGAKQDSHVAPKLGALNSDAAKLAAKIEAKKKLAEEGKMKEKKDYGTKYVASEKAESMTNPHTGKKDPEWTKKMVGK